MTLTPRLRKLLKQATATPEGRVVVEDMLANLVDDLDDAAKFYETFHWGNEPENVTTEAAPVVRPGDVLVKLGELAEVAYDGDKGGEFYRWVHEFRRPKPILAVTTAKKLVIVGGGYRVTRAGIVG